MQSNGVQLRYQPQQLTTLWSNNPQTTLVTTTTADHCAVFFSCPPHDSDSSPDDMKHHCIECMPGTQHTRGKPTTTAWQSLQAYRQPHSCKYTAQTSLAHFPTRTHPATACTRVLLLITTKQSAACTAAATATSAHTLCTTSTGHEAPHHNLHNRQHLGGRQAVIASLTHPHSYSCNAQVWPCYTCPECVMHGRKV